MRRPPLPAFALALLGGACGPGTSTAGSTSEAGDATSMSATATSETGEPMSCGEISLVPEYIPPVLMLVVDRSHSMRASWDHDGDPQTPARSRWASARELVELLVELWAEQAALGLELFPAPDACQLPLEDACPTSPCALDPAPDLPLALDDGAALLAALPGPATSEAEVRGASPASLAFAAARDHILASREGPLAQTGPAFIVLVTDGRTSCGDDPLGPDQELLALIESAEQDAGISTLVIGVDELSGVVAGEDQLADFDPLPWLEQLAAASALGQLYSASAPEALVEQFSLDPGLADCVVDLASTDIGPPSPEQVELVTWTRGDEGLVVPQISTEACAADEDGWTWLDEGLVLTFCGLSCELFGSGSQAFYGEYGCPAPP